MAEPCFPTLCALESSRLCANTVAVFRVNGGALHGERAVLRIWSRTRNRPRRRVGLVSIVAAEVRRRIPPWGDCFDSNHRLSASSRRRLQGGSWRALLSFRSSLSVLNVAMPPPLPPCGHPLLHAMEERAGRGGSQSNSHSMASRYSWPEPMLKSTQSSASTSRTASPR